MTLIDADQSTSTREMDIKTLEVTAPGEGDKSLYLFLTLHLDSIPSYNKLFAL
jgi:hypothetical protein